MQAIKKIGMIVCALCLVVGVCSAQKAECKSTGYRQELKRLKKEGWQVRQGLPLDQQLSHYYAMLLAEDEDHAPMYVVGKATGVGRSYDSALKIATINARRDLATNISVKVEALIEHSLIEVKAYSQQLVAERLVEVTVALTLYRINKQKNTEVCTYILYPWDRVVQAVDEAKKNYQE